jgi:hypothetical protein
MLKTRFETSATLMRRFIEPLQETSLKGESVTKTLTTEEAEITLAEFFEEHEGHEGVDAWPESSTIHTWCEACKEGRSYEVLGLREAVSGMLLEDRAITLY